MSGSPASPQGVGLHGDMPLHAVAYRGRGGAFEKRIAFADLPPDCQVAVLRDINACPGCGYQTEQCACIPVGDEQEVTP